VNNAHKAADDDMEFSSEEILKDDNVARLRGILCGGNTGTSSTGTQDFDDTQKLTWAQLKVHLGDPIVRAYFKKLDLEPWHLRSFFTLLKAGEEEPEINIDHFIRGCMRLRCNVKNIDLMSALHENKAYDTRRYNELKSSMKKLCGLISQLEEKEEERSTVHAWYL